MSTPLLDATVSRSADQLSTDLGGEAVILDLSSDMYFSVEGVGARIWAMISEPIAVRRILREIVSEYGVDPARCQTEVLSFLKELAQEGLIVIQ